MSASGWVVRLVPVFFSYSFKAFSKIASKAEVSPVVAGAVVEIFEDIGIVGSSVLVEKNRMLGHLKLKV